MRSAFVVALLAACFAGCGPSVAVGPRSGRSESDLPDSRCSLDVGQKIAPMTAARFDKSGQSVTFPSGKVTVLAFLSTWNRFADKTLPHLQQIHEKFASRGVTVIDIDSEHDQAGEMPEFWRSHRVSFPVVWDSDNNAIFAKLRASPVIVAVFDRTGVVRYVDGGSGSTDDIDAPALVRAVQELVASPDSTIASYAPPPCQTQLGQKFAARALSFPRLDARQPGATIPIPSGKWTLLAFVASWNGPAKESIRELQKIADAHAAQGLTVIAIAIDDEPSGVVDFIKRSGGSFPVVFDEGHRISARLQPVSMPTFILLDSNGVVRYIAGGYHGTLEADFEKAFRGLL
jgi:thiol-disulfide isomerase/thioredoxin